eukprot:gene12914-14904_t
MKFGKSLMRVVETSDPEWGPYWINYKFLKRKINEIVEDKGGVRVADQMQVRSPEELSKSNREVEFFRLLRSELKKSSDFFASAEAIYRIRKERIWEAFKMLEDPEVIQDKNTWTRLLMACVKFYKDVLLIENFAIMNYCGFSKILKKHDKMTGFKTREAFMRNVMNHQNFTHYPYIMELIKEAEVLFENIQKMENVMPLQDEERLFIAAMRDLNHQASRMQAEEKTPTSELDTPESAEATLGEQQRQLSADSESELNNSSSHESNSDTDMDNDSVSQASEPCAVPPSSSTRRGSTPDSHPNSQSNNHSNSLTAAMTKSVHHLLSSSPRPCESSTHHDAATARALASDALEDALTVATTSALGAARKLIQACPPGPHTHACTSSSNSNNNPAPEVQSASEAEAKQHKRSAGEAGLA